MWNEHNYKYKTIMGNKMHINIYTKFACDEKKKKPTVHCTTIQIWRMRTHENNNFPVLYPLREIICIFIYLFRIYTCHIHIYRIFKMNFLLVFFFYFPVSTQ